MSKRQRLDHKENCKAQEYERALHIRGIQLIIESYRGWDVERRQAWMADLVRALEVQALRGDDACVRPSRVSRVDMSRHRLVSAWQRNAAGHLEFGFPKSKAASIRQPFSFHCGWI